MQATYPKVLIIGHYFELSTGGGITMTNLFKGWDRDKIAVAGDRIDNPDYTVCDVYYEMGYSENKRRFPFFLWQKHEKDGLKGPIDNALKQSAAMERPVSKKMKLYNNFLHFSGLYHYTRRLTLSATFSKWMLDYSPDVIYTQLSSLELIDFVSLIHKRYKIPVIIHIMDDWPSTISKKGLLHSFWHKVIDKQFRLLLNNAKALLSISDAMTDEYRIRYNKEFIPFHNPINVNDWIQHSKKNYSATGPFVILYAGRIGTGIQECFLDVVAAIDKLIGKGLNIEFHLQSNSSSYIIDTIKKHAFVKIKKPVAYNELPIIFASVDVLLLPNDFDLLSISFLKYSMPTKASEYMATGTPILLYASPETAIAKHAKKNNWAYVVSENNIDTLASGISELYQNVELRKKIGNIAKEYSLNNYSDVKVNEQFRKVFE